MQTNNLLEKYANRSGLIADLLQSNDIFLDFHDYFTKHSSLTNIEFEIIVYFVSLNNNCHYCIDVHGQNLRDEIEKKYDRYAYDIISFDYDESDRKIIEFVEKTFVGNHPKKDDIIHTIGFVKYINTIISYYKIK